MSSTPALAPPERLRLDEQVAAAITEAILDGHFPPGSTLPPERDLAAQLQVNRTSLRQALARLEQMGLIETRQGSGNVVRDPAGLTDPVVVQSLVRRLGPGFLAELFEVREAVGEQIARLAARRATSEDSQALRQALDRMNGSPDAASLQEAELDLWRLLVQATRNRAMSLLFRWVESTYGSASSTFAAAFEPATEVLEGLEPVVEAVGRGAEDDAAEAVRDYLGQSAERMLRSAAI